MASRFDRCRWCGEPIDDPVEPGPPCRTGGRCSPEPEPDVYELEDAKLAAADEEYHRRKEDGELW